MFDQPNKLYLGQEFDLTRGAPDGEPVLVNLRELNTHAICLGMTGTGKTGLGIVALEETLLQGVPCIILDPKGDITNLALNFPDLGPADFAEWLDADEATRQNLTLEQLAERTATTWRSGLRDWGLPESRLRDLNDRACFDIYTPGSDAGLPVNVIQSLSAPRDPNITWAKHAEALRDRIAQIVSALLQLAGIDADPVKSREHILLSTIFESSWRGSQTLDLEGLILMIQQPPVQRVGAFDMDVFFPRDARFELAMALNNLASSPSFASWQNGEPLEIANLLKPDRRSPGVNPVGRTRASIFYLAHLDDAERQFFVTLLLSQLVMWMRGQSGTSQLRCLVYFDETFGYCPPFPRNPPTKGPMMSIIKQGRAAGLGMFLATQNPADLDYKGLSNIGTWFIGRLRTGRDRERALEGLEGAGAGFDRAQFEGALSTLPPRVFLVQSASGEPRFMMTRWAMSFLRGPLTRDQVSRLVPEADRVFLSAQPPAAKSPTGEQSTALRAEQPAAMRPSLPPDVRQVFVASSAASANGQPRLYRPHVLASATVRLVDRTSGALQNDRYTFLVPLVPQAHALAFEASNQVAFDLSTLRDAPDLNIAFGQLPGGISARWMKQTERMLVEHLYRVAVKTLFTNRALRMHSKLGESQIDFRMRCEDAAREKRNEEATRVRATFERRIKALQDKLAREHRELAQDETVLGARKREEMLAGVEAVFNFVIGKRSPYAVAFGAQRRRQTQVAQEDLRETERAIARFEVDLKALADEYRAALNDVSDKWMRVLTDITEIPLAPRKTDIFTELLALAWVG